MSKVGAKHLIHTKYVSWESSIFMERNFWVFFVWLEAAGVNTPHMTSPC